MICRRRSVKVKIKGPRIDYSVLAIKKGPSIQLEKGWKQAKFDAALAKAYNEVDIRDENRSRISGMPLLASSGNERQQREHNHLGRRSTSPSLKTAVKNIFLVSTFEHRYLTNNELLVHGTNANSDLRFSWNRRLVPVGREPFRIPMSVRYVPGKAKAAA